MPNLKKNPSALKAMRRDARKAAIALQQQLFPVDCQSRLLQAGILWFEIPNQQKQQFLRPVASGEFLGCYGLTEAGAGSDPAKMGTTVWAAFDQGTDYFGPTRQSHMVNYRVDDLDAALLRLRGAGAAVAAAIDEDDYGRFAWGVDPEGNRFELWEPAPGR